MDSLIPFNIRNLLLNHHLEVASDSPWEDLICTLCGKLSMNAYQTFCGCTFCRRCIYRRLQGIDEMCPGGKADCQLEGLVFDRNVTRNGNLILRISRLKVVCPHESCRVVTEVSQMMAHMKVCPERPTDCPFAVLGCTSFERVSSERMKTHILEEAVAHSQMMIVRFGEIHKCTNEDPKQKIKRAEEQKNDRIYERREMNEDHIQVAGWDSGLQSRMGEAIKALTDRMDAEMEAVKRKFEEGSAEVTKMKEEAAGIIDGRVGELEKTVDSVSKWINKGDAVGSLWFKVDGLAKLRKNGESIFSPYLYSHINGYKLRIQVNVSPLFGVLLSVSSVICKGEYDDVLSWPARGLSVSVNIINHRTKEAYMSRTIKYDNHECNKPINKDNQPYDVILGVSLSNLASTPGIIVSDSLLLLVTASPP